MRLRLSLLVGLMLMAVVAAAHAQSVAAAKLSGTVSDPSGAVINDATVTLRDIAKGTQQFVKTGSSGEYSFLALAPGDYELSVQATGFTTSQPQRITLTVGQVGLMPIRLAVAGSATQVQVQAEAQSIETQRTSSATTVD